MTTRCATKAHMICCRIHNTWHLPKHACVSCRDEAKRTEKAQKQEKKAKKEKKSQQQNQYNTYLE